MTDPARTTVADARIESEAEIPTWFGVGGRAHRLANPKSEAELAGLLTRDPDALILGDGANLLVNDAGVDRLVIRLAGSFKEVQVEDRPDDAVLVHAGAGAALPQLLTRLAREGLAGVEGLAGIPATVGGAAVMNAGGSRGCIGDAVHSIRALTRTGEPVLFDRDALIFNYRSTLCARPEQAYAPLHEHIVTSVTLRLTRDDPKVVRERLKDAMAAKKATQPLGDNSAGCCFKNWTVPDGVRANAALAHLLTDLGLAAGDRVPAGLLLDRAGCKGQRVGSAEVSPRHANFITVDKAGGRARDVIELMDAAAARVKDVFGVELEREVVVWGLSQGQSGGRG